MTQPLKLAQQEQYQAAIDVGYGFLHSFGKEMITGELARKAERSLVHCIANNRGVSIFDNPR